MVAAYTMKVCCFNTTNITVVSHSFQTNNDPVPYIRDVIVSFSMSSYSLMKYVIGHAAILYSTSVATVAEHNS